MDDDEILVPLNLSSLFWTKRLIFWSLLLPTDSNLWFASRATSNVLLKVYWRSKSKRELYVFFVSRFCCFNTFSTRLLTSP